MSHPNIYAALLAIQAEITEPPKDATNPHFRSKYVDLASLKAHLRPLLNKHGVLLYHTLRTSNGETILDTTARVSVAGESACVSSSMPVVAEKATPQALGSAITYATRYTTAALFGISGNDDDDGEVASKPAPTARSSAPSPKVEPPKEVLEPYTDVETPATHIAQCKTIDQLKRVGLRIGCSKLTQAEKAELKVAYTTREKELTQ